MTKRLATLLLACSLVLAAACGGGSESPDEMPTEESQANTDSSSDSSADEAGDSTVDEAANDAADDGADTEDGALPATADPNAPADVAAPPADASTTESGLAYKILTEGTGDATPTPTSMVRVHYTGWTTDGVKFDSSVDRGQPAEFPLDKVIPGWTEGVSLMKVGEKRRLWIPVELAYNNRPDRPKGMLVFDVELLAIIK